MCKMNDYVMSLEQEEACLSSYPLEEFIRAPHVLHSYHDPTNWVNFIPRKDMLLALWNHETTTEVLRTKAIQGLLTQRPSLAPELLLDAGRLTLRAVSCLPRVVDIVKACPNANWAFDDFTQETCQRLVREMPEKWVKQYRPSYFNFKWHTCEEMIRDHLHVVLGLPINESLIQTFCEAITNYCHWLITRLEEQEFTDAIRTIIRTIALRAGHYVLEYNLNEDNLSRVALSLGVLLPYADAQSLLESTRWWKPIGRHAYDRARIIKILLSRPDTAEEVRQRIPTLITLIRSEEGCEILRMPECPELSYQDFIKFASQRSCQGGSLADLALRSKNYKKWLIAYELSQKYLPRYPIWILATHEDQLLYLSTYSEEWNEVLRLYLHEYSPDELLSLLNASLSKHNFVMAKGIIEVYDIAPTLQSTDVCVLEFLQKYTPPVFPQVENRYNMTDCPICITAFTSTDRIEMFPCGHLAHKACVVCWRRASQNKACVSCRG